MSEPLRYPIAAPPDGGWVRVAAGVWWIRLPMPGPLAHVNVWALEEGDDWTLVDTGPNAEGAVARWETLLAELPFARGPSRVIVTHLHADHVGMAGWFSRRFDAPLWMTRLEYLQARVLAADAHRAPPEAADRFYRAAGWDEGARAAWRERFGRFGRSIQPLPDSFRRVVDGERIDIGGEVWEVVVGNGHSPEHACLYCAARGLLIAGDQVLPRISSNVSVQYMEPQAQPMADWLQSLARLRARVPDGVLVLPSHDDCFEGLHARLAGLQAGQQAAFDRLRERLRSGPARVVDVFGALFARPIATGDIGLLGMATGEALACLHHLVALGELRVEWRGEVAWYVLKDRSGASRP